MGCTSSVPNVAEVHANSTDETRQYSENSDKNDMKEDNVVTVEKNEDVLKKEIVLPICDNMHKPILDRNNCFKVSSNPNIIQDKPQKVDTIIDENTQNLSTPKNVSSLKEVVENVISNNILHETQSIGEISSAVKNSIDQENEESKTPRIDVIVPEITQKELKEEEPQDSASPSQSECSRATRWEALADMAAELPPTLTVDPITGHIYALSK
ncbi:unnamed protein product [Parnassius apollo]|uniref:(apollo) hypothetical protein n=1 Tax=Parnassius apollo TaxID=110799 RepID=A0A8S3W963_PARAO|nr:unnamed protein product [Parnassius apollo]